MPCFLLTMLCLHSRPSCTPQKLDVKLVPPEKVHPELFRNAKRKFKNIPWSKIERRRHDKVRSVPW